MGLLASIALGVAGCDKPKVVRAWPGMSASEFTRLNPQTTPPLKNNDLSWIGISTPFVLVLPKSSSGLHIASTQRGAGLQILSSAVLPSGRFLASPIIRSLQFSIGSGLEPIAKTRPLVVSYCNALADAAGVRRVAILEPVETSDQLRHSGGYITLCGGSGRTMSFQITATNRNDHWWYGRGEGRAYVAGFLGMPEEPEDSKRRTGSAPSFIVDRAAAKTE